MLRLPDGLRERIKAKADDNGRSMNAEIVQLLEREYPAPTDVMHIHLDNIRKVLDAYERTTDPKARLYFQHLVEAMAKSGHDLTFDDDDDLLGT
ncbi:Arc family DNA-binding protein [Paracoccus sp. YLB-12]|uniref:Arc family DNA-binding protein n=2 Tax=Paracoccus maritimus TaxID=2933292 RepID=A0ABT2KB77_9RHOB|nr:Arc family DNA-binding protein [Paracoccus sp. YLB-12]